MPSSYTSLLRFELPVQGELSGTWGNVVNTAITTPVSEAIAGTTSISVGATDYTLTNGDGASANEARKMFITATGSPGATRNVICPATSKLYVFFNNTSDGSALTFRAAGSGITVPSGQRRLLYCNGADVVDAVNGFGSLTLTSLTLGTALGATSGGTGQSSYAVGDLLYASSTTALSKLTVGATNSILTVVAGVPTWTTTLAIANGGTGQTTAATAFDALKQSATTSYVGAVQLATTAEVQAGTDAAKPITPSTLRSGALVRGTAQNTTSGSLIQFSSIPSWVKRITVMFDGVSTTGTNGFLLQLATGGTYATSGYLSYNASINGGTGQTDSTSGFIINPSGLLASAAITGQLVLVNLTGNLWVAAGSALYTQGAGAMVMYAGSVTLGGTLDRVRINSLTDTFDAGSVNIIYE